MPRNNHSKYEVKWSSSAEVDLKEIITFIALDDVRNAVAVLEQIKEVVESLGLFPKRGHKVPELVQFNIVDYLEITAYPWRVIYRVSDHEVFVLALLDGRRNIEDTLLTRLLHRVE